MLLYSDLVARAYKALGDPPLRDLAARLSWSPSPPSLWKNLHGDTLPATALRAVELADAVCAGETHDVTKQSYFREVEIRDAAKRIARDPGLLTELTRSMWCTSSMLKKNARRQGDPEAKLGEAISGIPPWFWRLTVVLTASRGARHIHGLSARRVRTLSDRVLSEIDKLVLAATSGPVCLHAARETLIVWLVADASHCVDVMPHIRALSASRVARLVLAAARAEAEHCEHCNEGAQLAEGVK